MLKYFSIIFILFLSIIPFIHAQTDKPIKSNTKLLSIIPQPTEVKILPGKFFMWASTKMDYQGKSKKIEQIALYLRNMIKKGAKLNLSVQTYNSIDESGSYILLSTKIKKNKLGNEGYLLNISKTSVVIKANMPAGLFYGIQTLRQLLPPQIEDTSRTNGIFLTLPCLNIKDKPRFKWRGMHLDVSRHFFSVSFIKKYLDVMALLKMNTFHWHLTDDPGWRIQIKRYPKLTSIGAWRVDSSKDKLDDLKDSTQTENSDTSKMYGGYYTQNQIKEIVKYAQKRFITIVPEIEMPAHSQAALAAYPQYSCTGGPFKVAAVAQPSKDIFCVGNPATYKFLENILSEVIKLFPGKYIHVGGDEVDTSFWIKSTVCQKFMKQHHLEYAKELETYFFNRINKFLNSKGKKMIGWDDILTRKLNPDVTIMSWRGFDGCISAVKKGHNVIMSPTQYCYFDYYQGNPIYEPKAIGSYLPLKKVYSFEPVPDDLTINEANHIIGAQGNVWTEFMKTASHVEYMILPRMCALSEIVWTPKNKHNFINFEKRMKGFYPRLDFMGINYRIPLPITSKGNIIIFNDTTIRLHKFLNNAIIRYTLDGTNPTDSSSLYTAPIKINKSETLEAITLKSNRKHSEISRIHFSKINPNTNGLTFRYYEGNWKKIPKFKHLTAIRSGTVYSIGLKNIKKRKNHYAIKYTGFIRIPSNGKYKFFINSDDGSKLYINNQLIVNNDGSHGPEEKSGCIKLKKGKYPIKVLYFQDYGGWKLTVYVKGPNISKQTIPAEFLLRQ